jgi:hypothetical protein
VVGGVRFRVAHSGDAAAIEAVMKVSARELSRGFYDERQTPSVERSWQRSIPR